jgi:hypothetical protein
MRTFGGDGPSGSRGHRGGGTSRWDSVGRAAARRVAEGGADLDTATPVVAPGRPAGAVATIIPFAYCSGGAFNGTLLASHKIRAAAGRIRASS